MPGKHKPGRYEGLVLSGISMENINEVERGVFYTLSLARNEPAYFIFVMLALPCLALRVALHAFPKFVEIS